jgi:hypothetical protein
MLTIPMYHVGYSQESHLKLTKPNEKPKILALAVCALALTSSSWATVTACAPSATGNTLATYAPAAVGTGCGSINMSFENLSLTEPVNNGTGTVQTAFNNAFFVTGAGASGNTMSPITATFDPTGNNWITTATTSGSGNSYQAKINYAALAHTGGGYTGGTYPTPSDVNLHWAFSSLTLNPLGSITGSVGGTLAIEVVLHICVGGTSIDPGPCPSGNSALIIAQMNGNGSTFSFTCVASGFTWGSCGAGGFGSNTINFTSHPVQIALQDLYSVSGVGTSGTLTLNSIDNVFGEGADTPEPATLGVVGLSLAALGALRYRRRKS